MRPYSHAGFIIFLTFTNQPDKIQNPAYTRCNFFFSEYKLILHRMFFDIKRATLVLCVCVGRKFTEYNEISNITQKLILLIIIFDCAAAPHARVCIYIYTHPTYPLNIQRKKFTL